MRRTTTRRPEAKVGIPLLLANDMQIRTALVATQRRAAELRHRAERRVGLFRYRLVNQDGTATEPAEFCSPDDTWIVGDEFTTSGRVYRIVEIRIGEGFRPHPTHDDIWVVERIT